MDYFGKALVGTKEALQDTHESPLRSDEEWEFLNGIFNPHFKDQITRSDIVRKYAGLRPNLCRNNEASSSNCSKASRESEIKVMGG